MIAIFLPDLRPGGAERLHVELARYWASQGIAVNFVLRTREGDLLKKVPVDVGIYSLEAFRVRNSLFPLVSYLRREKPHALLAAMWPLSVIAPLAARLANFQGRVVVSEHAPQSLSYAMRGKLHNVVMAGSMRTLYPLANARVAVSKGVADDMAKLSRIPRGRFEVIHNPAATGKALSRNQASLPNRSVSAPVILSVGTLKPVKRHDLLIQAFAKLRAPNAVLYILGEGPERQKLEALISELELHQRVFLLGYQSETAAWYAKADLFVLSSDYEGFGNVIVEALEQGTPVVSTDCPSGPREILEDGKYGKLVPAGDVGALAFAMEEMLSREHDNEALRRRAREFSVDKAASAYLNLLLPGWRSA